MTGTVPARESSSDDPGRPRRIMLMLLVVPVLWIVFELIWTATGEPTTRVSYARLVESLSADHQAPGVNGWSLLTEAVADASRIDDEIRAETASDPEDRRPDYSRLRTGPLDETAWSVELRAVETMRNAGVFDRLDRCVDTPNFVRPMPDDTPLHQVYLSHLAGFRMLARVRTATIRLALLRGDREEAVAALEQSMLLVRVCAAQPFLIDRLVTAALGRLVADELSYALAEFDLDEATALEMLAALDSQLPLAPIALSVDGERLMALDIIDSSFTDDGHGSGRLRPQFAVAVMGMPGRNPFLDTLAGSLQADRAETTALLDELYALMRDEAALAPLARSNAANITANAALLGKLTWRHMLVRNLLPMTGRIHPADDDMNMFLAGVRVLLALEAFHDRHGRWPGALDELVPEFLDALPVDPTTEGPFVYRSEGPADFRLYSIGADGLDDHAGPTPDPVDGEPVNLWGAGVWDTGADVLINRSRPEAVPRTPGRGSS